MYMVAYIIWVFLRPSISSHLFTWLHFVLPPVSYLVTLVTLMSLSWGHLCSCSLMMNDNVATSLYAHITFIYWPHLISTGSAKEWRWKIWLHRLGVSYWLIYSNTWTDLVTWPSNESSGCKLTPSLIAVHQTAWLMYFPTSLTAQDLIRMLHYKSKIEFTDVSCNTHIYIYIYIYCQ